jgi:2-keto-4-pentenoate hydratase/2-oxohepta-3-ene-1,7-dioic acid hydratase in catechol pathway
MRRIEYLSGGQLEVSNIFCVGRNYADHAAELGNAVPAEPLIFLKSTASLRGPHDGHLAFAEEEFHHEAELVLLVETESPMGTQPGLGIIGAVSLGLDLTRRQRQAVIKQQGHPWTLAKSFAGSAVVGPFLRKSELKQFDRFQFQLLINDQLRQSGDTQQMVFSMPTIINFLNSFQDLQRGDLIFTGTPAGVGPIRKGDRFHLELVSEQLRFSGVL